MASSPPKSPPAETPTPPAHLRLRTLHAYNMIVGLPLGERHADLLRQLYVLADQSPPPAGQLHAMCAQGAVSALDEIPGVQRTNLSVICAVFGREDIGEVLQAQLEQATGQRAAVVAPPPPPPAPDPIPETPAAAADTGAWDVVFCSVDVQRRCHRLHLLRRGVSLDSEPWPDGAEWAVAGPASQRLLGLLQDAPLSADQHDELLAKTHTFHTPPCPDRDGLLARLQAAHGPFDQLYCIEISQQLPNPTHIEQGFSVVEQGMGGRRQRLSRRYQHRPAGLGINGVHTALSVNWSSAATLQDPVTGEPYRPPMMGMADPSRLPLDAGWQVRSGWQVQVTALQDGPVQPVHWHAEAAGELALSGAGQRQEHFALHSAQVSVISAGDRSVVHSGHSPPPRTQWPAGTSIGAGELSVLHESGESALACAGEELTRSVRPEVGFPPQVHLRHHWQVTATGTDMAGGLCGALLLEQRAQLEDARASTQAHATATAAADAACAVRLSVGDVTVSLTPVSPTAPSSAPDAPAQQWAAGQVQVGGVRRWDVQWAGHTERQHQQWSAPVALLSGQAWGSDAGEIRDVVDAQHSLSVARMAAGYQMVPCSPAPADQDA